MNVNFETIGPFRDTIAIFLESGLYTEWRSIKGSSSAGRCRGDGEMTQHMWSTSETTCLVL